ncbi:MAG: M15 family metallopeptidase, partial [Oscillospiraceae bacterium]|nr:M15 family metallopeptidase [Oscillospiraceae bacterium]
EPLPFSKTDPLLILVNSHKTYENTPENLKSWRNQWGVYVAEEAYDALAAMIEAGEKLGLHFVVCSGYRSQELQEELFREDVKRYENRGMSQEEAVAAASLYTMPPGHSEHGTGLAVDIVSYYNQNLDSSQEDTSETRWLQTHCWEYGFILRYPKDKSSITGIAYEPWHYRYVGKEAAKYLTEHNMTLEEFHDQ